MKNNIFLEFIDAKNDLLPDFIKQEQLFTTYGEKSKKIFPSLGLKNFTAPIAGIATTNRVHAIATHRKMHILLKDVHNKMLANSKTKLVNYALFSILTQKSRAVLDLLHTSENYDFKLPMDILCPDEIYYQKQHSILDMWASLVKQYAEIGLTLPPVNELQEYKDFQKPIPNDTNYSVVFSGSGIDGLWDLATISMRGIVSCQRWEAVQAPALIGTLLSKFVGVIYLTSNEDYFHREKNFGKNMLYRCLVRYLIKADTKEPILFLDKMYPEYNPEIMSLFVDQLQPKTKLPICYSGQPGFNLKKYYYIEEPSYLSLHNENKYTYMDNPINIGKPTAQMFAPTKYYDEFIEKCNMSLYSQLQQELNKINRAKLANIPYQGEFTGATRAIVRHIVQHDQRLILQDIFSSLHSMNYPHALDNCNLSAKYYKKRQIYQMLTGWKYMFESNQRLLSRKYNRTQIYSRYPKAFEKTFRILDRKVKEMFLAEFRSEVKRGAI